MRYELKTFTEDFAGTTLKLETIADLDKAIDQLCDGVDEKSQERIFVEDLCPYFGVIWPAARALTEHLARMGTWLKGKTVLEVGCGLALPSLMAAKLGARVTATDFHPDVPAFLERNMRHNDISVEQLQFRSLDWRTDSTLGSFDFVIGSDVLYESSHPRDVAKVFAAHCNRGGHVILSDPGRAYLQSCIDAMVEMGFRSDMFISNVRDGHSDRAGDRKTKEVFVFSLQKMR